VESGCRRDQWRGGAEGGQFLKLSIANPVAAPYGTAALETMKALGVYEKLKPKIVQGNSIAQAFQFVDTRNAEVGFLRYRNCTA
jgi:molybdate transport system substrate-binding protein